MQPDPDGSCSAHPGEACWSRDCCALAACAVAAAAVVPIVLSCMHLWALPPPTAAPFTAAHPHIVTIAGAVRVRFLPSTCCARRRPHQELRPPDSASAALCAVGSCGCARLHGAVGAVLMSMTMTMEEVAVVVVEGVISSICLSHRITLT